MIIRKKIAGRVAGRRKQGLLHLSSKADYGFLLLMRLSFPFAKLGRGEKARTGSGVKSLRAIAMEDGLSVYFLQKVAADLRRAGLITAGRGKDGGYALAKPADKINLKEIIEALDGPLAIMGCLGGDGIKACSRSNSCPVRPGFEIVNETIVNALSSKTLYDLTKTYGRPGIKKPARKNR